MEIKVITVGVLETNCYIVFKRDTGEAAVIDPGADAGKILRFIAANNLKVKDIFLTHGHFDHILGVQQLKESTGARVVIHVLDADCLENSYNSLYMSFMNEPFRVCPADVKLFGGEKTRLGEVDVDFMHTPGHSPGSMCIFMDNVIFTGDTLFCGDVGRYDQRGGSFKDLCRSLARLYNLRGDYIVYPGHGEPTALGMERENNENFIEFAKMA